MPKRATARKDVRRWLLENDMRLVDLAERIGFSQGHISNVLVGNVPASEEFSKSLRKATGIDLRDYESVLS